MTRLVLVALGGALGSVLRYLVANAAVAWAGPTFPGTLAVNLVGSFLIGLVQSLAVESLSISEEARLFLATGVMGGLTTYSAFTTKPSDSPKPAPGPKPGPTSSSPPPPASPSAC